MMRVPLTIGAPSALTIAFHAPAFGVDLATVTSVHLNVLRRDGTSTVWACTIVSATPEELVVQYAFANAGELTGTGVYYLAPVLTVPGGSVSAQTVSLFVTSANGIPPLLEMAVEIVADVPIGSLGPVKSEWVRISASDSPYAARATSPWIAVDLSLGNVAVSLWSGNDGDAVVLTDYKNQAGVGGTLTLTATGGQLVPQGDGTYGASKSYSAAGAVVALKLSSNEWLPWR